MPACHVCLSCSHCLRVQNGAHRRFFADYNYAHLSAPVANQICNDGTLVTVMIEDQAGLDCVECVSFFAHSQLGYVADQPPCSASCCRLYSISEIATLDGIDLILIGTNDLTAELGVPGDYDSPLISAAYSKVISAARRNGKHAGVGGINSRMDLVKKFVEEGARFVMAGTDLPFLLGAARKRGAEMAEIREWTAVKAQEEPKTNGIH